MLRDPGNSDGGALRTGFVSPWTNNDATARNEKRLISAAGLARTACLFWNAIPWDLEGRDPSAADKERGAVYLKALIALLPKLRAIVACGNEAQEVCRRAGLTDFLATCHPGNRGLSGGVAGARASREADFIQKMRIAARRASNGSAKK